LLQHVISDPEIGLQARIKDLLDSIDRRGDFDAGAKKLDTFVVVHEKAAGLFTMLKESAQTMLIPIVKGGRSGNQRCACRHGNHDVLLSLNILTYH
jgi:hypothetical protein